MPDCTIPRIADRLGRKLLVRGLEFLKTDDVIAPAVRGRSASRRSSPRLHRLIGAFRPAIYGSCRLRRATIRLAIAFREMGGGYKAARNGYFYNRQRCLPQEQISTLEAEPHVVASRRQVQFAEE